VCAHLLDCCESVEDYIMGGGRRDKEPCRILDTKGRCRVCQGEDKIVLKVDSVTHREAGEAP
jgi:hypothetical protein